MVVRALTRIIDYYHCRTLCLPWWFTCVLLSLSRCLLLFPRFFLLFPLSSVIFFSLWQKNYSNILKNYFAIVPLFIGWNVLLPLLLEVDAVLTNVTVAVLHARQVYTCVFVLPSVRDWKWAFFWFLSFLSLLAQRVLLPSARWSSVKKQREITSTTITLKIWLRGCEYRGDEYKPHALTSVMYFSGYRIWAVFTTIVLCTDSVKNNKIQKRHVACLHTQQQNEKNTLKLLVALLVFEILQKQAKRQPMPLESEHCLWATVATSEFMCVFLPYFFSFVCHCNS